MSGSFVPFVTGSAAEYARAVNDPIPLYDQGPEQVARAWASTAAICGVLVAVLIAVMPVLPAQDARGRTRFSAVPPIQAMPVQAVPAQVLSGGAARGASAAPRDAAAPRPSRT